MPHIYMIFDFENDEEKAQLARHKLEGWKQAFRLDKKLLYKFERPETEDGEPEEGEKPAKTKGAVKSKKKLAKEEKQTGQPVKLLIRLAFSGHEKLSEQRWVDRIPSEDPFQSAKPQVVKTSDATFAATEKQFEDLA